MSRPALFKKLVEFRKQVGAITKDSKNAGQGFKFRGYEALYAKARPVLDSLGIWVETEVANVHVEMLEKGSSVSGTFIMRLIDADSGEASEISVPMYGADSSDKAAGKACSYAMKYAFFTACMIPTEEDMDAQSPSVVRKKPSNGHILANLKACRTKADLDAWKLSAAALTPEEKSALADEFTLAVGRCK